MPMFLSVSLFKACLKSLCYYLPVCRMGVVRFIFYEVVLFQEVVGFEKNTWYCFFALGGAVSCPGHPSPSPQSYMCNMQRAISVNIF